MRWRKSGARKLPCAPCRRKGRAFCARGVNGLPAVRWRIFSPGSCPSGWARCCSNAGIAPLSRPAGSLSAGELSALEALLCEWRLPALGTAGYANAQVMAGGLDTRDFDPRTLQSRKVPGLFAAGEILNVDGGCGGYNLQWAWASGLLAGSEAAKRR